MNNGHSFTPWHAVLVAIRSNVHLEKHLSVLFDQCGLMGRENQAHKGPLDAKRGERPEGACIEMYSERCIDA